MIRHILFSALLAVSACAAFSASVAPAPRLARTLSAERAEACRIRERHNRALTEFFALYGMPSGNDASNVVRRTRAIGLLAEASTNSAGKSRIGAVLKDLRSRNPDVFKTPGK